MNQTESMKILTHDDIALILWLLLLDNHYISNNWTPKLIMKLGMHNWNKSARRSDI